ncbi:hypothetical protein H632_c5261p0 [Helicosporidium sp. ATCC 50920]|nr:hypothetical protein H632_c5261p0 [Helicosporidium sp. ATCC 50920]|eukprot:KDD71339.1 hypothetical protein H632_c5261p0 [Helicosporidium sp. ATCC 50920]
MAVGYVVLAASKELARAAVRVVLPQVYRLVPLRLRLLWQPPVHDQFRDAVESARSVYRASAVDCNVRRGEDAAGEAAEADREPRASAKPEPSASSQTLLPNLAEGDQLARNRAGVPWDVDITARFFAYAGIGWGVSEGSAWAFHLLGMT